MKRLNPGDRVLVFTTKLSYGHLLAKELGCDFYRGSTDKQLTDGEREKMVQRWRLGSKQHSIMVATDAFGPGNDYAHVRQVWFVGTPRGLVDMLQMAGRGGRDGDVADIYFFHLTGDKFSASDVDDHLGRKELEMLMRNPAGRCWREIAAAFLDGVSNLKCDNSPYNWPCPRCASLRAGTQPPHRPLAWLQGTTPIVPILPPAQLVGDHVLSPQVGAVRARAPSTSLALPSLAGAVIGSGSAFTNASHRSKRAREEREEPLRPAVERINRAINKLSGHCGLCHVSTGNVVPLTQRGVLDCEEMMKLNRLSLVVKVTGAYLDWKKLVNYQGGQVCYSCHLPFMQDLVHLPKSGPNRGCNAQHLDMVMPVVYWA